MVRYARKSMEGRRRGVAVTTNIRLVVLGSRGSIPVSGADFEIYGGNTTSFAIVDGDRLIGFVDAGTGLISYQSHGLEPAASIDLFLTHYHWDHIQGLSMLDLVWSGGTDIVIRGPGDPHRALTAVITPPWFPGVLAEAPRVRYESIDEPVRLGELTVTPFSVEHPQRTVGYRIDGPSSSVAIVTDHESGTDRDAVIVEATRGVDMLIHDAQYLPDEIDDYAGWGHSTWEDAVLAAERVGADRLILTSLDPRRTDHEVEAIVHAARKRFYATEAAYPGLSVPL
jgi:ribonuclease BN (tRNA processing enzyme)